MKNDLCRGGVLRCAQDQPITFFPRQPHPLKGNTDREVVWTARFPNSVLFASLPLFLLEILAAVTMGRYPTYWVPASTRVYKYKYKSAFSSF